MHPRPTPWNKLVGAFSQQLDLRTATYADWFSTLEDSQHSLQSISNDTAAVEKMLRENPALRLLELFRAGKEHENDEDFEPPGLTKISCAKAVSVSESLRTAGGIDEENVRRWLMSWRKSAFI